MAVGPPIGRDGRLEKDGGRRRGESEGPECQAQAAAAQAYEVLGTVIVQADPDTAAQIEQAMAGVRRGVAAGMKISQVIDAPAAHPEGTRRPYLR